MYNLSIFPYLINYFIICTDICLHYHNLCYSQDMLNYLYIPWSLLLRILVAGFPATFFNLFMG